MHAQRSHSYSGAAQTNTYTPTHYLLKGPVNEMCLTCHDARSFAPDVLGADTGPGYFNRSAGSLNRDGMTVDGYSAYMGHSLDSTALAPGGTFMAADGLTCVDCHHQHGYAGFGALDGAGNAVPNAYRNLAAKSYGGSNRSVSYAIGSMGGNDTTKDVFERFPADYETVGVNLNEPNLTDSGVANWCAGCHGEFHGAVGGTEIGGMGTPPSEFIRHPNATVNIGDLTGGHSSLATFEGHPYRVRVMSADGDWGTLGATWDTSTLSDGVTPTCLSCHKAHGNARPFGLIYADGTGDMNAGVGEDGNGTGARDLCKQCHVQGG
jgi:cytochrome c553